MYVMQLHIPNSAVDIVRFYLYILNAVGVNLMSMQPGLNAQYFEKLRFVFCAIYC